MDLQEVLNRKLTYTELQSRYQAWSKKVRQEYIQLSDMEAAPDDLYEWTEEIVSLSGWIVDVSLYLEGDKKENIISDREEWLIQNSIRKYYGSLERLKQLEKNIC